MNDPWRRITDHAARTGRPLGETIRHHVLEGVLRRVARLARPDSFVLRGGMLTRLWAAPTARPADDLDFVGTFPYSVEETARRFAPALRDTDIDDGVAFDPDGLRARAMWLDTGFPGVRLGIRVGLERPERELQIDVGFGDPLVPAAKLVEYPAATGDAARVWCAAPETMVGWKLHGLAETGERRWRPKDLYDLCLITENVGLNLDELVSAIAVAFTSRGYRTADAPAVFGAASWWGEKTAHARWREFCERGAGLGIPEDLAEVVARVERRLRPTLEQLPG